MPQPLVSIVMAVWNEEKYLSDSIQSILNQTFTDYEFVITNDGSTDKTQDILEIFALKDSRIMLITNKINKGVLASLNNGIKIAKGKYIARMDSGDISKPTRLEKQIIYLQDNKNISILGTCGYWINEKQRIISRWEVAPNVNAKVLYKGAPTIDPSLVLKREVFETIGFYNETIQSGSDFEFLARALINHFNIANLQEYLICTMKRYDGLQFKHIRRSRLSVLRTKCKYLPYFLSFSNLFYTTKSFAGCLLPTAIMKKLANRWIMQNTDRKNFGRMT